MTRRRTRCSRRRSPAWCTRRRVEDFAAISQALVSTSPALAPGRRYAARGRRARPDGTPLLPIRSVRGRRRTPGVGGPGAPRTNVIRGNASEIPFSPAALAVDDGVVRPRRQGVEQRARRRALSTCAPASRSTRSSSREPVAAHVPTARASSHPQRRRDYDPRHRIGFTASALVGACLASPTARVWVDGLAPPARVAGGNRLGGRAVPGSLQLRLLTRSLARRGDARPRARSRPGVPGRQRTRRTVRGVPRSPALYLVATGDSAVDPSDS